MIDILMSKNYCDIVLKGGNFINVLTREIYSADVAIKDEFIMMVGDCAEFIGPKTQVYDVTGKFIAPGFIDAHMHFESSMLTITEFVKLSVLGGTTTLFEDPHEIANVLGCQGILEMIKEAETLPTRVFFTVPALVPDLPGCETSGEDITSKNINNVLQEPLVQGIGEMQGFSNCRSVYDFNSSVLDDLLSSVAKASELNKTIEGNAPGLSGAELAAHILACGGETSCHESTTKEECLEKIRNGITVFMRHGSTQKNMAECIKTVKENGIDSRKLVLATDDTTANDLVEVGHMDRVIRDTIAQGIDPVEAIQMATINPAIHYNHKEIGCLSPGKIADVVVIDDLPSMKVSKVFVAGQLMVDNYKLTKSLPQYCYPESTKKTMLNTDISEENLIIRSEKQEVNARAIVVIPDQNLTNKMELQLPVQNKIVQCLPEEDIIYFCCIERHGKSHRIGKAFLKGMGMENGAIAQSIAHDAHNELVCGVNHKDMVLASNELKKLGGGIVLAKDGKIIGSLKLNVAGLISDEYSGQELYESLKTLEEKARQELGITIHSPFMHISFLSLITSPEWKITDFGIYNVRDNEFLAPIY